MLILVWPGLANILVGMTLAIPLPPPLLYTLAYIDCACFKIKSNDLPLLHFLK